MIADYEWALRDLSFDCEMALENVAIGSLGTQLIEYCLALFRDERTTRADQLRLRAAIGGLDYRLHIGHARATPECAKPDAEG